jgi:hypothetical protein
MTDEEREKLWQTYGIFVNSYLGKSISNLQTTATDFTSGLRYHPSDLPWMAKLNLETDKVSF